MLTGKKYKTYNFKNRLIELRKQNNWTKTQVANRLGISIPAYSGYEQGTREPTLEKRSQASLKCLMLRLTPYSTMAT